MKRIESPASAGVSPAENQRIIHRIALLRRQRFKGRLFPIRTLIWMAIGLAIGLGIAALGAAHLPQDDVTQRLTLHFLSKSVSFGRLFGRLFLSLLPACVLIACSAFTYFHGPLTTGLLALECFVFGVCLCIVCQYAASPWWIIVYAVWAVLRVGLLFGLSLLSAHMAQTRAEARCMDSKKIAAPALRQYAKRNLIGLVCAAVVSATMGGLYLLL